MATPVSFQAGIYLCGETQNSTWLSRIHDAFKLFIVCLITWAAAKDRCWARAFKFLTAQQYHKPRKSAELLNFSHFAGSEGFSDCLESFFAVMLEELISGIFCICIFALTSQNFHKMLLSFALLQTLSTIVRPLHYKAHPSSITGFIVNAFALTFTIVFCTLSCPL